MVMAGITLKDLQDLEDRLISKLSKANQERIDSAVVEIKTSLKSELEDLSKDFSSRFVEIEKRVMKVERRLDDDVDAAKKALEVTVNGIPHTNNENLHSIFESLSSNFGYSVKGGVGFALPVVDVYRITSSAQQSIIVQFANNLEKRLFLKRKAKNLKLSQIEGFDDDSRIYVDHNLGKHNYNIKKLCQKLHQKGLISKFRVEGGKIWIQLLNEKRFVRVDFAEDLKHLLKPSGPNSSIEDLTID